MFTEINDATFEAEVVNSDTPVVLDFWAPWCGPCKMMLPILERISKQYGDKVKFCKINVDDNPNTSADKNITSIPTLLFVKNGVIQNTVTGMRSEKEILTHIEAIAS